MAVRFYMDVHVPQAITDQLRRRTVDVLTAIEDGADELSDSDLLDRAAALGRVLFTHDIRFKAQRSNGSVTDDVSRVWCTGTNARRSVGSSATWS